MKLELKHIAQYLPYGLTVQWCNGEIEDIGIYRVPSAILTNSKPILRPISDLYKVIDGVIHIVELAKIANIEVSEDFYIFYGEILATSSNSGDDFWFKDGMFVHVPCFNDNSSIVKNQLQLFEYLFQHHFDVFGLIDKGLAIDINKTQVAG